MRRHGLQEASTPLFCTGTGGMSVEQACKQMREALDTVLTEKLVHGDWCTFHAHHRLIAPAKK